MLRFVTFRPLIALLAAVVSAAMIATGLNASPAAAADEVVIVTSAPSEEQPDTSTISVTQDPTQGITVSNPGSAAPVASQCTTAPLGGGSLCIGTADDGRRVVAPLDIRGSSDIYGNGPEAALSWIEEEAVQHIAALHGVPADNLVRTNAAGHIRAYTVSRILDILDKELYGEPLTDQERVTFDAVSEYIRNQDLDLAVQAVLEVRKWEEDACRYPVPRPPAPELDEIPNPVALRAKCLAPTQLVQTFEFAQQKPPAEVFERWAAYRTPSPLLQHSSNPLYKDILTSTRVGYATLAGIGIALALSGVTVLAMVGINFVALPFVTNVLWYVSSLALSYTGSAIFSTVAIGGAVAIIGALVAIALVTYVGVITLDTEGAVGPELVKRMRNLAWNDDPLGVYAKRPFYEGLDFQTRERPANPDNVALQHTEAFSNRILAMVLEWTVLTPEGDLTPDNIRRNVDAPSGPQDRKFVITSVSEAGQVISTTPKTVDSVAVRAPDGTVDSEGNEISGYRVHFNRGWLMVSEYKNGAYAPAIPRLSVPFIQPDGTESQMSVIQQESATGQVTTQYALAVMNEEVSEGEFSDTWKFRGPGGRIYTTELQVAPPITAPISLLPTVFGPMYPGRTLTFQANVSTPGQSAIGTYSWVIERLDETGAVAQTWTVGEGDNAFKFQRSFAQTGPYRVTARYRGTANGDPFDTTGTVFFTVEAPTPELYNSMLEEPELSDDLALNGKLFLDLRMMQETPSDTLDVEIEWATAFGKERIVEQYVVQCVPVGDGTCETGALTQPLAAPVNPQWSSSPSYTIPQDQFFLPFITVRVTNSHGATVERVFEMPGDHRPTYAEYAPYVEMPVGTFSRINVTEAIPSPLQGDQRLSIFPYVEAIQAQLPATVFPDLVEDNGQYFLELRGTPMADDIGLYSIEFPVEQLPLGSGLRAAPAIVTLNIVPGTESGYRAILRGTPSALEDRYYRSTWPDWYVQVALVSEVASNEAFAGTVRCQLLRFGQPVVDKRCDPDRPFPWPADLQDGDYQATVWTDSGTQQLAGPPYTVTFNGQFVRTDLSVKAPERRRDAAVLKLAINDRKFDAATGVVPSPFSDQGYRVTCSINGGTFKRCLDSGRMSLDKPSGRHTLRIKVTAFDGAVVRDSVRWRVPG